LWGKGVNPWQQNKTNKKQLNYYAVYLICMALPELPFTTHAKKNLKRMKLCGREKVYLQHQQMLFSPVCWKICKTDMITMALSPAQSHG